MSIQQSLTYKIGAVLKLNGAASPHVLRQTTVHEHNLPHVLVYWIMASVLTKSPLLLSPLPSDVDEL